MNAKDIFMNAIHVHVYCLMFTLKLYITVCFNVYIFHLYHIFKKNVYNNTINKLYEPTRNLIDSEVKKKYLLS